LDKAININKMQHHYIQNLQKANLHLKSRIKDLEELNTKMAQVGLLGDPAGKYSSDEYKLVSIGNIDKVTRHDLEDDDG
jgi:hypothetical protein